MFPINWERLDASVFTSMLPATKRKSRTCATRETDVISERKHCSRRRRHTQVELSSSRKCADKTQTIARKRWHGARKRKRSNVRSTCGRLNVITLMDNNVTSDPNDNYNILLEEIKKTIDKHMPLKTVKFDKYRHNKETWITSGILRSISYKDKLHKQLK